MAPQPSRGSMGVPGRVVSLFVSDSHQTTAKCETNNVLADRLMASKASSKCMQNPSREARRGPISSLGVVPIYRHLFAFYRGCHAIFVHSNFEVLVLGENSISGHPNRCPNRLKPPLGATSLRKASSRGQRCAGAHMLK